MAQKPEVENARKRPWVDEVLLKIDEFSENERNQEQDPLVDSSSASTCPEELLADQTGPILNINQACEQSDAFQRSGFVYILDAPTSPSIRTCDDPLTFLNRDQSPQFYRLSLAYILPMNVPTPPQSGKAKVLTSILSVQFRDPSKKSASEALKCWEEWAARQPNSNLSVLDVSLRTSVNVVGKVEEFALNAVKVHWIPGVIPAMLDIAVKSLSSDFCSQKGVKGVPLQLQIDTYDEAASGKNGAKFLVDRAYCQMKTYKNGVERKLREELNRLAKLAETSPLHFRPSHQESVFVRCPETLDKDAQRAAEPVFFKLRRSKQSCKHLATMMPKQDSQSGVLASTFYVKQEVEDIFTPITCNPPTVIGFVMSLATKYDVNPYDIRHVYQRIGKGVVVAVDNALVENSLNNRAFLMKVLPVDSPLKKRVVYDIILAEVDNSSADFD